MPAAPGTAQWSSNFAFIMAAVGSSVGLGNLWRFSSEAGSNGGGAFILVYLLAVIFVALPVLLSEYMIGRAGLEANAVSSLTDVAIRSKRSMNWSFGSWVGMIAGFLIVTFYCVIAGWVVEYLYLSLTNDFSGLQPSEVADKFTDFVSNPMEVLPWFLIFAFLTVWLVSRGVNKGIELAAKVFMPIFFILLIVLAIFAVVQGIGNGGTAAALNFLYVPDIGEMMTKNPEMSAAGNIAAVSNAALGQAFFSVGVGSAIMITYGSYIPDSVSLPKSALIVALMDTGVALVAGLAIFPIVFGYGLSEEAGPALLFITLPNAFEAMGPLGIIVGSAFFFLAFFAALTSSVSLLEPSAAYVSEKFKMSKAKAAWSVGVLMVLVGLISVFGVQAGGKTPALDAIDAFTGKVLLPLAGFIIVLFVGWRASKQVVNEELLGDGETLGRLIFFLVRWVAPIFVGAVLVTSVVTYISSFVG